jgi:hypothetical protein
MNLKKIAILGLAGVIALNSCSTIRNKIPEAYSVSSLENRLKIEVPSIQGVSFDKFYPEPRDFPNIDPLYRKFITGELDLAALERSTNLIYSIFDKIWPRSFFYSMIFKIPSRTNFVDEKNFQKVFSIAESLGYSIEDIKKISIHDAIFLSGLITSEKMQLMLLDKKDSERQKKIIELYKKNLDENFSLGLGVCGQYAETNLAVFNLLKTQNPNLKNVTMKYTTTSEEEHFKNSHAWNEVIAPESNGSFLLTAVDATALEHTTGSLQLREEVYNMLSTGKYYIGKYYLYEQLATAYQTLASKTRPLFIDGKFYPIQEETRKQYLDLAFVNWLQSCEAIFEILDYTSKAVNQSDLYTLFKKQLDTNFNFLINHAKDKNDKELSDIKQLYEKSEVFLEEKTKRFYNKILLPPSF